MLRCAFSHTTFTARDAGTLPTDVPNSQKTNLGSNSQEPKIFRGGGGGAHARQKKAQQQSREGVCLPDQRRAERAGERERGRGHHTGTKLCCSTGCFAGAHRSPYQSLPVAKGSGLPRKRGRRGRRTPVFFFCRVPVVRKRQTCSGLEQGYEQRASAIRRSLGCVLQSVVEQKSMVFVLKASSVCVL